MFTKEHIRYEALDLPDRSNLSDRQMLEQAGKFHQTMRKRHSVRDFSDRRRGAYLLQIQTGE